MSRTAVIVERVRDRFDRIAQRGLDERRAEAERNRRASIADEAREDLQRALVGRPEAEAEVYCAAIRQAAALASPARVPTPSPREAAEALFSKGRAA